MKKGEMIIVVIFTAVVVLFSWLAVRNASNSVPEFNEPGDAFEKVAPDGDFCDTHECKG